MDGLPGIGLFLGTEGYRGEGIAEHLHGGAFGGGGIEYGVPERLLPKTEVLLGSELAKCATIIDIRCRSIHYYPEYPIFRQSATLMFGKSGPDHVMRTTGGSN